MPADPTPAGPPRPATETTTAERWRVTVYHGSFAPTERDFDSYFAATSYAYHAEQDGATGAAVTALASEARP